MFLKKLFITLSLISASVFLSSCEEEEAEAISAAQSCLNEMKSTMSKSELATKAAECRSILGTPTSEKGFIIQCSSFFLEEAFFGSKVLEAFERIDSSNGENDSLNLMSAFAFNSSSNASSASSACQQTGVKTFQVFGDVALAATTIGSAFPGGLDALVPDDGSTPSLADFESALAQIDTAAEFEALATPIVSIATTLCSGDNDGDLGEDVCPTLEAVTSSTSNAVIGECMQFCMSSGNSGQTCTATGGSSITCP